jgi:purine-binding chemotaxis protein CheW
METLIFECCSRYYGLPAAAVSQVSDPLPVTPLPFAPAFVDGLVNLHGHIVPQIDAGLWLGTGERLAPESGNLLAVDGADGPYALHVGRLLETVAIAETDLRPSTPAETPASHEFSRNGARVALLQTAALALPEPAAKNSLGAVHPPPRTDAGPAPPEAGSAPELPCLLMLSEQERYALPLDSVREIVEATPLTRIPHARSEVAGMMLLRGAPVLVLSLDGLLGREGECAAPRFVVVLEQRETILGLGVAKISGIRRFAEAAFRPIPERNGALAGYLLAEEGDAAPGLIGLLDPPGLIPERRLAHYRGYLARTDASPTGAATAERRETRNPMLLFRLGRERWALPLEAVVRVAEHGSPTPLPRTGDCLPTGAVQIQGRVLPVADLRREIGFPAGAAPAAYVVVRVDEQEWALAVDQVERIAVLPDTDSNALAPSGYFAGAGRLDGKLLSVLSLAPLRRGCDAIDNCVDKATEPFSRLRSGVSPPFEKGGPGGISGGSWSPSALQIPP